MSANRAKTSRAKSLPMIVDVAVDEKGKTLYHVHETTKAIQEPTPVSTSVSESARFIFDSIDDLNSPADTVSSSHSPSAEKPRKVGINSDGDLSESPGRRSSVPKNTKFCPASHDDIWSDDVQTAFEEALAIVPKCGLNKIKIGGKCCGRNELIADFILAKTGKFRSRKQVSSHIQVVKNLKSKENLISLINDGPEFSTPEEAEENMRHFEEVFSKININKSLGFNSTGSAELSGSGGSLRRNSADQLAPPPKRKRSHTSIINVRNVSFTISDGTIGNRPITLTTQKEAPMQFLSIKENVNITSRFPGLEEFSNTNVPLIHNMVNILNPLNLATEKSIDSGLKTNFNIEIPGHGENLSSFTTVYSFGDEVLKVNEENFEVNTDQPFLVKFWKCFFLQLLQVPTSLDAAFKGTTVKQVIYDNTVPITSILPKSKIKAVIIWEFSKVDDANQAVSSSSRLFLPPTLGYATMSTSNSNYSIRPPQSTYNFPRAPTEYTNQQFTYSPNSSVSSLQNFSSNQDDEVPDISSRENPSGISQLSFPAISLPPTFLDQLPSPQYSAPTTSNHHFPTSLDGDSMRYFTQDEQQFLGTYYQ